MCIKSGLLNKCFSCCFVSGCRAGRAHIQDQLAGRGQETQGGGGRHMAAQGESLTEGKLQCEVLRLIQLFLPVKSEKVIYSKQVEYNIPGQGLELD